MVKSVSWEKKEQEPYSPTKNEKKPDVVAPVNSTRPNKHVFSLDSLPANSQTSRRGRWNRKGKKLREPFCEKEPVLPIEDKVAIPSERCSECEEKSAVSRGRCSECEEKSSALPERCECEEKSPAPRGHYTEDEEKSVVSQVQYGKNEKSAVPHQHYSEGVERWRGQLKKTTEPLKNRFSEDCERLPNCYSDSDRALLRCFSESSEEEDDDPVSPRSNSPPVLTKPTLKRKVRSLFLLDVSDCIMQPVLLICWCCFEGQCNSRARY